MVRGQATEDWYRNLKSSPTIREGGFQDSESNTSAGARPRSDGCN